MDEAVTAGATIELGGRRDGATYPPTVLSGVPADARVCAEEVFGPVLVVARVAHDQAAFAAVNDSAYGLQAGSSLTASTRPSRRTAPWRWAG